jgi:hypothetical protein
VCLRGGGGIAEKIQVYVVLKNGMIMNFVIYICSLPSRLLVGIPEGKTPLGRRRHRWKNAVKCILVNRL